MYRRSVKALKDDLIRTEKLGGEYLVIHPGSYSPGATLETGLERIAAALQEGLDAVPGTSRVLIENMAGGGRRIGGPFREMGEILRRTNRPDRLGVCFDTCHAYAAGYDISSDAGVSATLAEFDREVGLDKIFVFHVNDSAGALKSHRDLHENLGEGNVGLAGLTALFRHPAFARCALILETPKDPIPTADLDNLRRLRQCLPAAEEK
jgi:deoxyribonuclease-4